MRIRLYLLYSILSLIASWPDTLQAQTREDTLLSIIRKRTNDQENFLALKEMGDLTQKKDPLKALTFYQRAIAFPFRSAYTREFLQTYNSLGELYHGRGAYDSSLLLHRQALAWAQQFNLSEEMVIALRGIGLNFMRQSQNDSSRFYFYKALSISLLIQNRSLEAGIYVNLGNTYLEENKYKEALEFFIKSVKIYEEYSPNPEGLSKALVNIANIENILGNHEQALDYTKRSLRIAEENNLDPLIAYGHRLLGRIYRKHQEFKKALEEYRIAVNIYNERGDVRNEVETRQNIGNIYYDLRQFTEALQEYEKSLQITRTHSSLPQTAYIYSGMGFVWKELKDPTKALLYFDSSIVKAREGHNRFVEMDGYQLKSMIYAQQKRYKEAYELHQQFAALKDSITEEENKHATEELEAKYQSTKKQDEIELLKKDQLLKNISLRETRTLVIALAIAFLSIIIIGFLIFNRNKIIHQTKRQIEIERVRNQIARDLHDDMGSTLSSINIISQMGMKENPSGPFAKYFRQIGDQSLKIMESMADLVWSINPENDSLAKTVIKMKEFAVEILEAANINYQFEIGEIPDPILLNAINRKNLFLIFKEAINNISKYSECHLVTIGISITGSELFLTLQDDGKGFNSNKQSTGNGLRNMKARANEIGATLDLKTAPGCGTLIQIKMALP